MINKPYKHVIWDWNGTLLDDTDLCIEIINMMLIKRNLPALSLERYREIFGFPIKDYYLRTGFDFSIEPFERLALEYLTEYDSRCTCCSLHNGAEDLLKKIHAAGISQSVLSASNIDSLKSIIRNYQIDRYFSHVSGLDNNYAGSKVDIGINWLAAQDFRPAEVLLIGDTEHDHETAQAMGVDCLLVSQGHQSVERLERCDVAVYDSLMQLL